MAKKLDGIIEAVRYTRDGKIDIVRAYVLRGVAYSDRVLLDRETLLARIKDGKRFAVGQRKEFLGGTFDLEKPVKFSGTDGKEILTTRDEASNRDELEGALAF
jgi:hypothetical protein